MKILFARAMAMPFLLGVLGVLYYAWENEGEGAIWVVPFLLTAAFIWVLAPQIDWWWYSKRPPQLEDGVIEALERYHAFYQNLDKAGQQRFRNRLALTRMGTDWTSQKMPDDVVPTDIQTAIAAESVVVTWDKEEFLFREYEKVVVAPSAFLSPEHKYSHNSESYLPENCMLFNAKSVMEGFIQPEQYFNVVRYEYCKAYIQKYGPPPGVENATWEQFEAEKGITRQAIETAVGIPGLEPGPVWMSLQF